MKQMIKYGRNEIEVCKGKNEIEVYNARNASMHYAFYDSAKNALYWDIPLTGGIAKAALKFAQSRHKAGLLKDVYND